MKIISIILLLISSKQVIYCLSSNKTFLNKKCRINSSNPLYCNPGTHCNIKLGFCECHSDYPIPVPKTGFCLDYRNLGEGCLLDEQCSRMGDRICSESKQIDSMTENDIRLHFELRDDNIIALLNGKCQCKPGYRQVNGICYQILIENFECSWSSQCNNTVNNFETFEKFVNNCCPTGPQLSLRWIQQ